MRRCACGRPVILDVGAVKVMDVHTGRVIRVICSECVDKHRPSMHGGRKKRGADKYNAWRNYHANPEEALPE